MSCRGSGPNRYVSLVFNRTQSLAQPKDCERDETPPARRVILDEGCSPRAFRDAVLDHHRAVCSVRDYPFYGGGCAALEASLGEAACDSRVLRLSARTPIRSYPWR